MDPQAKRNFKLVLEYDGGGYHGWQRQQGFLTIQEVLESRLEIMLGDSVRVRGSGRTDAGVHAKGQTANFYARTRLKPEEILRGLNSLLPPDIAVLDCRQVDHSFHARFSATRKTYEYVILNRAVPSALERRYAWHVRPPLDASAMEICLEPIRGERDFSAFMASGSSVRSTVRHMYRGELHRPDADHMKLVFEANGFLRHMVRNLVGTLVDAGKGKRNREGFAAVLAGGDRRLAGMTAPAHGLYLLEVRYDKEHEQPSAGSDSR